MCGQKLETRPLVPAAIDATAPRNGEDRLQFGTPEYAFQGRSNSSEEATDRIGSLDQQREIVRDRTARNPAKDNRIFASSAVSARVIPLTTPEEEAEEELKSPTPNKNFSTGIGGPSILGIGYDSGGSSNGLVYDKPRNDGFIYDTDGETPEYLLDDQPSRTVSWRAWALFAILLVGGALAYIQWRASRHEGPDLASILEGNGAATTAEKSLPGTVQPNKQDAASSATAPQSAKPNADDANANETKPTPSDAKSGGENAVASDKADASASSTKNPDTEKDDETASASKDSKDTEMSAAAATKSSNASAPESDEAVSKATKPARTRPAAVEDTSADETRTARSAPPKPLGDKDPLIIEAENYIQGRRVRQNCSQGVNLLREAVGQGNPAADVKLGALYWSGTCVTQSKVTAYQWFTRAHEKEPRNIWIERSRNSLWASMSSQEKRRVAD
jgi:hypothetical protein